ncbi:MAG: hypothetical protein AAFU85_13795 [Planctomycetota bacterium]
MRNPYEPTTENANANGSDDSDVMSNAERFFTTVFLTASLLFMAGTLALPFLGLLKLFAR